VGPDQTTDMKKLRPYSRVAIAVSALLLISAYYVPIWQILMWAPQYPEGLDMKIWIDDITGDVKIISALNHYIGMKHIEVSMFPEFGYMIYIVAGVIGLGLIAALVNRRFMLVAYTVVILACGIAALADLYLWGYDYGHNLDPRAPIIVPGMYYQPPLIGTKQLLNFTAFSGPDIGAWIFLASGLLAIGALVFELYKVKVKKELVSAMVIGTCLFMSSCSVEPEPLQYGKDACYVCKMTLMDNRFGAEVVSTKGKVFKFDDTNCLVNFLNTRFVPDNEIAHCLITDFASPGILIDAKTASYVKSEKIKTPMASNIAAFQDKISLEGQNDSWKGIELSWGELITEFK
jgi:copper chaperone NosL